MMDGDLAIKINQVSKVYKLYDSPRDRLKEALNPFGPKRHRDFYALRNIDLEVKKGEVLGFVGRNGAGKSTLLKIITGVLQPNAGTVEVNGQISALLELGSGLNPQFSGIDNIRFQLTMGGFTPQEIDEKFDEVVAFAEIGDFIRQPVKTYSSGMRARLGFAVAINIDPDILIVDEVLAVGDVAFRRKCYAKIEEFFSKNKTILFVSHETSTIQELCKKVVMLHKGEKIIEGTPKNVACVYLNMTKTEATVSKEQLRREFKRLEDNLPQNHQSNSSEQVHENPNSSTSPPSQVFEESQDYNPSVASKSMTFVKNHEIDFIRVNILTTENKKVNTLLNGQRYTLSYTFRFRKGAKKIRFPFQIKTMKGFAVSGAAHPLSKTEYIDEIKDNDLVTIRWGFKCNLLKGYYLIDLGVHQTINGESKELLGVFDAYMFRVVMEDMNVMKWGIIDLEQQYTTG